MVIQRGAQHLRARHEALASAISPITEQLRSLVEERRRLEVDTQAAEDRARATWSHPGWAGTGEDRFWQESGRDTLADALAAFNDEASALERPEEAADTVAVPEEPAGWIPKGADLDKAAVERLLEQSKLANIPGALTDATQAVARAAGAVDGLYFETAGVFAEDAHAEERREVGAAFGRVLLILATSAENAMDQLRYRLGEEQREALG